MTEQIDIAVLFERIENLAKRQEDAAKRNEDAVNSTNKLVSDLHTTVTTMQSEKQTKRECSAYRKEICNTHVSHKLMAAYGAGIGAAVVFFNWFAANAQTIVSYVTK